MPEGDTIFRAAQTLQRALAGRVVTRFDSVYPAVTRVAVDTPIVGRLVDRVTARGKHLLLWFSGDLVLRTHMRMHGSWHVYRPGERWQRPSREMRVLIATDAYVAVAFNVPEAECLAASELARHPRLAALGPDLLSADFDEADALARMRARGTEAIDEVLLDQRVMAGVGNVFKSEILFAAGVPPLATVNALSDDRLRRIIRVARQQLGTNVRGRRQTLAPAPGRRTTGRLHPDEGLWVYGRAGEPCRRCGTPIVLDKRGADARLTYWCPRCQP
ncbi:MAG: Fpg/Nei family DNA glycosylase [Vicinamibacterales bacterium]